MSQRTGNRPPRRTNSGIQVVDHSGARSLSAVLFLGRANARLGELVVERLGKPEQVVVVLDVIDLNQAANDVTAASLFAFEAEAAMDASKAFKKASVTWPCCPRLWFGRYSKPSRPPRPTRHMRDAEILVPPYFDDFQEMADHLVTRIEQGIAERLTQIAVGRAFAQHHGLGQRATELIVSIALRLPEANWGDVVQGDSSGELRSFLRRSIYKRLDVSSRVDLANLVHDFARDWRTDLGVQAQARLPG